MTAVFVTGTGTGVGKTWLTAALLRRCQARGLPAAAIKPVISGFGPHDWHDSDSGVLLRAMHRPLEPASLDAVSPWRLGAPLSPDMAAAREDRRIDFDALLGFCRERIAETDGLLLIEGVGGAMVPLDERHTVLDWLEALALPAVVVAGSYLGTISHTLTTLAAMRARGASVRALAISASAQAPVPVPVPEQETAATVRRFTDVPTFVLPRETAGTPAPQTTATLDRLLAAVLQPDG